MRRFLRLLSVAFPVRSIVLRVALSVCAACAVLLAIGLRLQHITLIRYHQQEDIADLNQRIAILRTTLRSHGDDPVFLRHEVQLEAEAGRREGGNGSGHFFFYARILDEAGGLIIQTEGMDRVVPTSAFRAPIAEGRRVLSPDDFFRWSAGGRKFDATSAFARVGELGPVRILQVALDRSEAGASLRWHRRVGVLSLGAAAILAALVGLFAAWRGLRPIRILTRKVEQIGRRGAVSAPLFHDALPLELAPLARRFDETMAHLEANRLRLSAFAGYAAHELRTPLQILSSEAEAALREERTPRAYRELLESSLEEYHRLADLIENLLFIAQASDPRTRIERVPIDVRIELNSIREYFEPLAAEKRILITCDGQEHIDADRLLFRRAVSNLVSNALRHTPTEGQIVLSVGSAGPDAVSIKIIDTGGGITPEQLERIRAGQGWLTKGDFGDTKFLHGLGLPIVESIAELHGAQLRIFSELGRGTTAELLFPRTSNGAAPAAKPSTFQASSATSIAES
jgi:two-component system, OmpR family, heavy metal sensor histidine kinase CusS